MINTKKEQQQTLLHMVLLTAAALLVLGRSFFSFAWSDESYYLTIVQSYWQGARPFVDVWRQEQFYSVILLPFYTLYRAVVGSADGIYLATRLLCKLLDIVLSVCVYRALKPKGAWIALAAAMSVLFYSRANISGFSYYDWSMYFFLGGMLVIYGWHAQEPHERLRGAAAGVLLSLCVLCTPFLAFAWIVLAPLLFLKRFCRYRKLAAGILIGTVITAAVYLLWVFSRATPMELWVSFPHLFEDPEANTRNLQTILGICRELSNHLQRAGLYWKLLFLYMVANKVLILFKKRKPFVPGSIETVILFAGTFAIFLLSFWVPRDEDGNAEIALCLFALQCWLMTPKVQRDRRVELCFYWGGMGFALAWQFTSNTGFGAMTLGFQVAVVASCCMIANFLQAVDHARFRLLGKAVLGATLVVLLAMQSYELVFQVFRDGPLPSCTARLEQGPAKGLYTTAERKEKYDTLYDVLTGEEMQQEGPVFLTYFLPWGYLCTDRECGAPGGWKMLPNDPQLQEYYTLYPEKFPTTVLVLDDEFLWSVFSRNMEPNREHLAENGFSLLDEMEKRGYAEKEVPCGRIYSAPQS